MKERAEGILRKGVAEIKLISIRFGNLIWKINPSELKVEYEQSTNEEVSIGYETRLISKGTKLRLVKGRGFIIGEDKLEFYDELERIFLEDKEDILLLPGGRPFKAKFTFLRQYYPEGSNSLAYEFTFTECKREKINLPSYIKCEKDESLWDIAYRFNIDINKLVKLNPHIENINFLKDKEVVYLC